uniref:BTB domain-containing protein n=1 Tax=Meloidogyne hapla TaxID=6305 RepID=A0A1I8BGP4_MELHA
MKTKNDAILFRELIYSKLFINFLFRNETKDFKNNYGWGVNRYLDDNQIDGSVIIGCEVEFVPYNIEYEKNGIEESNVFNKSQNLFKNMLNQGTLSDCVIKIGNENIKAHRCILAQNSKVFLKMFEQNGMVEAQDACFNYLNENKKFLVSNEWKEFKAGNVILANKLLELALANC